MPEITHVGRVLVPVADQDEAISFYTAKLGFSVVADTPFAEDSRWVEVGPPGGGTTLALVPPQGQYEAGRMTGIALECPDAAAVHARLREEGVDVDPELMGGGGGVPPLFFFRDNNKNQLMVVQTA
jgi:catechol 2,3-dioxygenase-like lactoylglutathione lyase family enzyme